MLSVKKNSPVKDPARITDPPSPLQGPVELETMVAVAVFPKRRLRTFVNSALVAAHVHCFVFFMPLSGCC